MNIYYNLTRQCRVDENNCRLNGAPVIYFGEKPAWVLHLFTGELGEPGTAASLAGIAAYRAAIDVDWTGTTEPMCRTNAGITAGAGIVTVPLDANTIRFGTVLNGARSKDAYFELRGLDTDGNVALLILFPVTCHNVIDPEGGEPPEETPSGYATEAYVDAVVSREIYVQFSADGTNWHDTLTTGDVYERIKHGSSGEWSDAFAIPYGPQGQTGPQGETGPQGQTGAAGTTPHIDPISGHWMLGTTDTGIQANADLLGASVDVSSVSASNTVTVEQMPAGVLAPSGRFYPVEKTCVTVSSGVITLDFTAFLAYENAASFSGTWEVYFAGGPQGPRGLQGETGIAGYTPIRGVDYWTAADIAAIEAYCLDAIENGAW